MLYLWIALAVIPSPILIFISSEAIAIIGSLKGYSPLALASALAMGQTIGFTCLCLFGEQLASRWGKLRNMKERIDIDRYREHVPKFIASASFLGLPPLNASCLAAATMGARIKVLVPIIFSGRWTRYWIVASLPEVFEGYVDSSLLPMWLQQL